MRIELGTAERRKLLHKTRNYVALCHVSFSSSVSRGFDCNHHLQRSAYTRSDSTAILLCSLHLLRLSPIVNLSALASVKSISTILDERARSFIMDTMLAAIGNQIPNEVKLLIVKLLPRKDQWRISHVSQEWRRVALSDIGDNIEFSEALQVLDRLNFSQNVRDLLCLSCGLLTEKSHIGVQAITSLDRPCGSI